jgi:hypothetical protein
MSLKEYKHNLLFREFCWLILKLFNDFISTIEDFSNNWDYVQRNGNDEEGSDCGIHLKQLRKAKENLIQNSQFSSQIPNQVTPECESDAVVSVGTDLYCESY